MKGQFKHSFFTILLLASNLGYSQISFDLTGELKADFVREFFSINPADLDNDGNVDVVLGHQVYLNQGNGSLVEKKGAISTSVFGRSSSVGDIDGDGDIDVFVKPEGALFINDGNASFAYKVSPMENLYSTPSFNISEGELLDLDSDGDLDCFVYDGGGTPHLFINDGNSNFTKVTNSVFPQIVNFPAIHVEDLDNDGDEDIIVNGMTSNVPITQAYLNEGALLFSLLSIDLPSIFKGSIETGDLDSDGDKDLLMTGEDIDGFEYTEILINQGELNFLPIDNELEDLSKGSIELIDVDSDLDLDLVLTGVRVSREQTSLYLNDGNANFTEASTNFDPVSSFFDGTAEGVRKLDVDQDGDEDLIIAGFTPGGASSHLYINNGDLSFTKIDTSPFLDYEKSSTVTGDINNDGWDDVIIMGLEVGYNNVENTTCDIYINNQNDEFSLTQSFHGAQLGDLKLIDFDNDGDLDFVLTGNQKGDSGPGYSNPLFSGIVAKLYVNDGNGFFEESMDHSFVPVWHSSIEVLDFDGDNDADLIIIGRKSSSSSPITSVYENDGSGGFSLIESGIPDIGSGDIGSGDLDGDGDIDVIICGNSDEDIGDAFGDRATKIYYNDGTGQFEDSGLYFVGFSSASINIGDTNSDGDLDFTQSGQITRGGGHGFGLNVLTLHYKNNGDGTFDREIVNDVGALELCSSELIDIDNDSDLDYIVTGEIDHQFGSLFDTHRTKMYLNNGTGDFFEISSDVEPISFGSMSILDFNNDGFTDLLLTGNGAGGPTTRLYQNTTDLEDIPSSLSNIPDQVHNLGFGTIAIDLSTVFPENAIRYKGTVYDSRIVEGSFDDSGNNLNFVLSEGVQSGKTEVSLTAIYDTYIITEQFSFRVNTKPQIKDGIKDQVYTQGFISSTIDISSRYSDPDGDELTYTIEVSDESIVNANYVDGILTLNEGVITGETTVTITIDDGNTGVILDEFSIKVEKPLSIDNDKSLLVYPNPSPQNFTLVGSGFSNVDVKSIDGKQVNYSLIERGDEVVVQFNEEYEGILILKVEIEDQKIIRKLIKY